MAGKFVRFSNGRVSEIVGIDESTKDKCVNKFKKMFHPDLVSDFEYEPSSKVIKVGQVKKGTTYHDYVEPDEEKQRKVKFDAQNNIIKKQNQVIWELLKYVNNQADCPQELKDLKTEIKSNRDKL